MLLVGEDAALPLPWLAPLVARVLAVERGPALLLHGAPGDGLHAAVVSAAQALACETEAAPRPCGRCGACRLMHAHVHPDVRIVLPQALRGEHSMPLPEDNPADLDADSAKRKPSRQIRVQEVREATAWNHETPSRSARKVLAFAPAEAMNEVAANALLKTLEEPSPSTRLILGCADPARLLPTVRSRCQQLRLPSPSVPEAIAWLQARGLRSAATLLAAAGGRPLDALALAAAGVDAAAWQALPAALVRGEASAFSPLGVAVAVDAMGKLLHDALLVVHGASPRYFDAAAVPRGGDATALHRWRRTLLHAARHAEHPWHAPLLLEALVAEGAAAFAPAAPPRPSGRNAATTLPE
jgi:DNA polymerase-3 subunit delta'